jgi:hypothetical protein
MPKNSISKLLINNIRELVGRVNRATHSFLLSFLGTSGEISREPGGMHRRHKMELGYIDAQK